MMSKSLHVIILLTFFSTFKIFAQEEIDIIPALQKIESGHIKSTELLLKDFKSTNPNDPSVLFLDAVMTKDGDQALNKYLAFIEKYPKNKFTDAALFRIFSYYYSLGHYKKAETYFERLKNDFPDSPYIQNVDKSIPLADSSETKTELTQASDSISVNPEKTADSKKFYFTIQAGAFMNIENAKNLCENLNKEKYSTEITTREIGGSLLNVVNVGKFQTEKEAEPVLTLLASKYNLKGRIVKLNK
jgi:tetratricopeptide (TPR) repeat protein